MPAEPGRRVLVTGGLGYVGRAVARRLVEAGHRVTVLTREPVAGVPDPPPGATVAAGDVTDADAVWALVHAGRFDAVCHLAALVRVRESFQEPLRYWDVNLTGTLHLLRALADVTGQTGRPARLVFASSASVYGQTDGRPAAEDHPAAPTNPYGATKLAAERLIGDQARTGALGAVTLRMFSAAGAVGGRPDPDESRIIPKALAVAAGRFPHVEVNGDGSAVRDLAHVADLADAWLLALETATPGEHRIYNAGTGVGTSIREIIATVERVTGRAVPVVHRPAADEATALLADTTRSRGELGWTPTRSGIERIVADAWAAASG